MDRTNKGPIWDMTKNFRGFWYSQSGGGVDVASGAGSGGAGQPLEGASWLKFGGLWGDKQWPTNRHGQYCVGKNCLVDDGPTGKHTDRWRLRIVVAHPVYPIGPLGKNLGRAAVCQNESGCKIQNSLPHTHT